jgi:hypothetical protein
MRGANCVGSPKHIDLMTSDRGTAAEWLDL